MHQSLQCFWNPDFFRTQLLRKLVMNISSLLEIQKLALSFSIGLIYMLDPAKFSVFLFCFLFNCKIKDKKNLTFHFSMTATDNTLKKKKQHSFQVVLQITNFYPAIAAKLQKGSAVIVVCSKVVTEVRTSSCKQE